MPDQSPNERRWTIYVHDDGRYLSINDGIHGDTLLRMPDGWRDRARVRAFVEEVMPVPSSQEERCLACGGPTGTASIDWRPTAQGGIRECPDPSHSPSTQPVEDEVERCLARPTAGHHFACVYCGYEIGGARPSSQGGLEERVRALRHGVETLRVGSGGKADNPNSGDEWYQAQLIAYDHVLAVLADGEDRAARLEAILRVALEDVPGWEEEAETLLADGAGEGEQDAD